MVLHHHVLPLLHHQVRKHRELHHHAPTSPNCFGQKSFEALVPDEHGQEVAGRDGKKIEKASDAEAGQRLFDPCRQRCVIGDVSVGIHDDVGVDHDVGCGVVAAGRGDRDLRRKRKKSFREEGLVLRSD